MIDTKTKVKRADNLISSDIDDETVLLSIANGNYYGLNSVASRIWSLLQSPLLVSELIAIIHDEFEIDKKDCEEQVLSFLNILAKDQLVEVLDHAQA